MAHGIGKQVVVEGVELQDQANYLRQVGCADFQGFLLAYPVPPGEIAFEACRHDSGAANMPCSGKRPLAIKISRG